MDVFIRNLDPQATETAVEEWLTPILEQVNIRTSKLRKPRGKSYATLTVTDVMKGQRLIDRALSLPQIPVNPRSGRKASFTPSKFPPDDFDLKVLRKQEIERNTYKIVPSAANADKVKSSSSRQDHQALQVASINCGRWQVEDRRLVFVPFLHLDMKGTLCKKGRALVLNLSSKATNHNWDIVFEHMTLESAVLSKHKNQECLALTLSLAPKLYSRARGVHEKLAANEKLAVLQFLLKSIMEDESNTFREGRLPDSGVYTTGTCLVYQIQFGLDYSSETLFKVMSSIIPKQVLLQREDVIVREPSIEGFDKHVAQAEVAIEALSLCFAVKFQLHALWMNAVLSPREVQDLLPTLSLIGDVRASEQSLLAALRFLHMQLQPVSPGLSLEDAGLLKAVQILRQGKEHLDVRDRVKNTTEVPIHRAIITPAGIYLYGPDKETPNRVIRQYPGHEDCFLRVSFSDESGDQIHFNSEASNYKILRGTFLSILQNGLTIAGERFSFLGFSHSSLRSQSCWFMRPFVHNGAKITAPVVIENLGDFSHIQSPAKCAARIGQAFSDTERAMTVSAGEVKVIPDVTRGRFIFTDGCGTISQSLWLDLKISSALQGRPTLCQIRYQGAKGMVSLDTRLSGRIMCLRESMVKFQGSPSNDVEICGINARPLSFRLNRQIIKILEDLGVKDAVFEDLQLEAVNNLKKSAYSAQSAGGFLCDKLSDNATGIAELISILAKLGIEAVEDQFIRKVTQALIGIELRELKFRTRIPVQHAVTLYGISDETEFLGEREIYVTFNSQERGQVFLEGQVAVTRSPALHPGDIQVVTAVAAPLNSPLRSLTNCVVFSQKGKRDVPSMLGGGDLDGDLFNIIYDDSLLPARSEAPAEYEPTPAINIGRSVTSNDMAAFFVNFMENDQLGRIATLHQVFADRDEGTRSDVCLNLAKLHSDAVDFSKSGQPVDFRKIPKTPSSRPDFMAPNASTKVEKTLERAEGSAADKDENSQYVYYKSEHILGKLFRSINEDEFFDELADDTSSIFGRNGQEDVVDRIWQIVDETQRDSNWEKWLPIAQEVKEYYNSTVSEIMTQYAVGRSQSLTEQEVLIGTIVGRSGAGSRHQREQSEMMRARYKREVQDIRQWMKMQTDKSQDDYTSLAVACLSLCITDHDQKRQPYFGDHLRSFAWFAAAICVPRLVNTT